MSHRNVSHVRRVKRAGRAALRYVLSRGVMMTIYSNNKHISCNDLEQKLKLDITERPLLIDARKPSEYIHSHIPHSINVYAMRKAPKTVLKQIPKDREIVVYCAAGLRSGYLTSVLRIKYGFQNVYTLKEGFYKWANEQRVLVDCKGLNVSTVEPQHVFAKILLNRNIVGIENNNVTGCEQIEACSGTIEVQDSSKSENSPQDAEEINLIVTEGDQLEDLINPQHINIT